MAQGTSWMLSPVGVNGDKGHSVVITNGTWYDAAHENAKHGRGVDMGAIGWHTSIPYDWDHWVCSNMRQLIPPWMHGYEWACGVRVIRASDALVHHKTKRHCKWARLHKRK